MYTTQGVLFQGCELAIPISLENGPPLRYMSTLFNPIEEKI